jgi:hypothetical protein
VHRSLKRHPSGNLKRDGTGAEPDFELGKKEPRVTSLNAGKKSPVGRLIFVMAGLMLLAGLALLAGWYINTNSSPAPLPLDLYLSRNVMP